MLNMTKDNRAVEVWDTVFWLISVRTNKTTRQPVFVRMRVNYYNTIRLSYI